MSDAGFQFYFAGAQAKDAANDFVKIIEQEFGVKPKPVTPNTSVDQTTKGVEPLALTAVILTIPPALLAAIDLVDRIKKKKQLDTVLQKTQKIQKTKTELKIHILTPKGTKIEIHSVTSAELLDAASEVSETTKPQ